MSTDGFGPTEPRQWPRTHPSPPGATPTLLSLLPLSPRVGPSSGLLPVSISLGQDEAKAYVTYRRARVTTRRVYRRAYRRSYYHY